MSQLAQLRDLKQAVHEGLVDEHEYARAKAAVLQSFGQADTCPTPLINSLQEVAAALQVRTIVPPSESQLWGCLLYTSDAADEEDSVDLGGRRIIKKKKKVRVGRMVKKKNQILREIIEEY
eukprot:TRINITY_DN1144_c0_g1_i2.p1 TRINITY_DN1144_c0_g1~~TRINITY_DN1144_c0_g1_i2.p1  ORF type:complete len:121 (-),score=24.32 TRINITY_DN1144_c0_g1_i2:3-365(-)